MDLMLSKSNSAVRTASSLSSAAETISPVGPVFLKEKIKKWNREVVAAAKSFHEYEEMKKKIE